MSQWAEKEEKGPIGNINREKFWKRKRPKKDKTSSWESPPFEPPPLPALDCCPPELLQKETLSRNQFAGRSCPVLLLLAFFNFLAFFVKAFLKVFNRFFNFFKAEKRDPRTRVPQNCVYRNIIWTRGPRKNSTVRKLGACQDQWIYKGCL